MSNSHDDLVFGRLAETYGMRDEQKAQLVSIADSIRASLFHQQRQLIEDPCRRKAALCPRRAGKSYVAMSYAFDVALRKSNARVAIVNISLKVGKRNYWHDVVPLLVNAFGIPCKQYQNEMYIRLTNGSLIYILGADKRDAIEDIRGTQFDLVIVDECKSYPTGLLNELVLEVLLPTLRDRRGTILLIGTPGSVFQGIFFETTYPGFTKEVKKGKTKVKRPMSRTFTAPEAYWTENPHDHLYWSKHSWQVTDNQAKPHLWGEALEEKEMMGWADDEPIFLRESKALWVTGADEFVYAYANLYSTEGDKVHWEPDYQDGNPHGLKPKDNTEWRYILGVDLGYEDAFALVVLAYNKHDGLLYHLYDYHCSHLDPIESMERVERVTKRFGRFDIIVVDPGAGGPGFIDMLRNRLGLPARTAEKSEKAAYREFLNADFRAGRVKVLAKSDLATQMATLQFDMSSGKSKEELARREKLVENPTMANDLCDAFLYAWRWAFHYWKTDREEQVPHGSVAWFEAREEAAARKLVAERGRDEDPGGWTAWTGGSDPLRSYRRRDYAN